MDNNKNVRKRSNRDIAVISVLLIMIGAALLAKNLGYIEPGIIKTVISWQMVLTVAGLFTMIRTRSASGSLIFLLGLVFLLPLLFGDPFTFSIYWPLILVAIGVSVLLKHVFPGKHKRRLDQRKHHLAQEYASYSEGDGFLESDVRFGSVEHIFLDPFFKGGTIRNTFGATVVDLRHTQLMSEVTYLDIDCSFGGIELSVPDDWKVESEVLCVVAGVSDKRRVQAQTHNNKKLVLRGKLTMAGLEIKS